MTRQRGARRLLAAAASLVLGACAPAAAPPPTPPVAVQPPPPAPVVAAPAPPEPSAREKLAAPHNANAATLERDGLLRQALDERSIALTIDPANAEAREGRRRVAALIEQRVAQRMDEGRAALARGSHVEARRRFLAALALDPANRTAFEMLQNEVRDVEMIVHTVRQGDTLASLSQRYYGDRARAEVIAEANELSPGARLAAGRTIKIPEIPGLPFARPEPPRRASPAGPRSEATPPTPETAPTPPAPAEPARPEVPETNPLIAEAQEALERKDYAGALADIDKVLAGNPRNAEGVALRKQVLYQQGKSQLEAKNYQASYQTLTQLARVAPDYENTPALVQQARGRLIEQHYGQGIRYYREEKLREAIAEWREVLELDPQHANARRNIEQAERLIKGLEERRRK